ncbi:MAG: hypothetical protein Q3971_07370 [Moraxella sp.]|nr:hypothetical protein [Moraxella sp.]
MKMVGRWLVLLVVLGLGGLMFWQTKPTPKSKPTTPTDTAPPSHDDVVYDVKAWAIEPKNRQLDALIAHLGTPVSNDETLDFYGNLAIRHHFSHHHEPPLYLVVGSGVLELVWYHANAKDDDDFKNASQAHAKKAHALATAVYGKNGNRLMQAILVGKSAPTLVGLTYATCQAYQCRLVMNTKILGITTTKV